MRRLGAASIGIALAVLGCNPDRVSPPSDPLTDTTDVERPDTDAADAELQDGNDGRDLSTDGPDSSETDIASDSVEDPVDSMVADSVVDVHADLDGLDVEIEAPPDVSQDVDPDAHRGTVYFPDDLVDCQCADDRASCLPAPTVERLYHCGIVLADTSCEESPCPPGQYCGSRTSRPGLDPEGLVACRCDRGWLDAECLPICPGGTDDECRGDTGCFLQLNICTPPVWEWECGSDVACEWWQECDGGVCTDIDLDRRVTFVPVTEWPALGFVPQPCGSHVDCEPDERCVLDPVLLPGAGDGDRWWAECQHWPEDARDTACPDSSFMLAADGTNCLFATRACTIDEHCESERGESCHAGTSSCILDLAESSE